AALDAALNAAKLLRMGFTSIRDVGTRGNIAVVVRDAVEAGRLPGPRIKASKQIISVWGGLGDFHPTHIFRREQYAAALTEIVTGPWERGTPCASRSRTASTGSRSRRAAPASTRSVRETETRCPSRRSAPSSKRRRTRGGP